MDGTSEPRQPANPALHALARLLSLLGHPLVLVPITVAIASRNWQSALLIAGTIMLPLAAFILLQMRRGAWSDFDVSNRKERSGLYYAAIPILVVAAVFLRLNGAGPAMMRGLLAAAAMLAIGLLGMRWLKISIHMMFATYCAVALALPYPRATLPIAACVAAIAWSRHHLRRHTWPEIAAGTAIGALAAWWAVAV